MLCCLLFYYPLLYYPLLYIILCYIILYYIILYSIILFYIILYYVILYYIILEVPPSSWTLSPPWRSFLLNCLQLNNWCILLTHSMLKDVYETMLLNTIVTMESFGICPLPDSWPNPPLEYGGKWMLKTWMEILILPSSIILSTVE